MPKWSKSPSGGLCRRHGAKKIVEGRIDRWQSFEREALVLASENHLSLRTDARKFLGHAGRISHIRKPLGGGKLELHAWNPSVENYISQYDCAA